MKIALIGNGNDIHTQRWVKGLSDRGYSVHLITAHYPSSNFRHDNIHVLPFRPLAGYYLNAWHLRKLLTTLEADIVHPHYASGYGTLARVCQYRPYILSVWGSDVFEYPDKSKSCLKRVQKNLRRASAICSTSHMMARRVQTLCPELKSINITPFGVDTILFCPSHKIKTQSDTIVVGTVKKLETKYGIDILLRSFAAAREELALSDTTITLSKNLRLRIVGIGSCENKLKELTKELGIANVTEFVGFVPNGDVPNELNKLDIYVAASRYDSETFGVAIIEASACELPVIVSDRGGLPEVVVDKQTGFIVQSENVHQTTVALKELVINSELRRKMGMAGRKYVQSTYEWNVSLDIMEKVYCEHLSRRLS